MAFTRSVDPYFAIKSFKGPSSWLYKLYSVDLFSTGRGDKLRLKLLKEILEVSFWYLMTDLT